MQFKFMKNIIVVGMGGYLINFQSKYLDLYMHNAKSKSQLIFKIIVKKVKFNHLYTFPFTKSQLL